jgi:hypothetical protein
MFTSIHAFMLITIRVLRCFHGVLCVSVLVVVRGTHIDLYLVWTVGMGGLFSIYLSVFLKNLRYVIKTADKNVSFKTTYKMQTCVTINCTVHVNITSNIFCNFCINSCYFLCYILPPSCLLCYSLW